MLTALEQPVPPEPYCPPIEVVEQCADDLLGDEERASRKFSRFFDANPKQYAKALAKLTRKYQWSPGPSERLLLATRRYVLSDRCIHLLNYSKEEPRHRSFTIADIEAVEFTPSPPAKALRMTLRESVSTVRISLYSQPDTPYTVEATEHAWMLLHAVVRNAHGYPREWVAEPWTRNPPTIRRAIAAVQQGTPPVTLQRQLTTELHLPAYAAREFVAAVEILVRQYSPRARKKELHRNLGQIILGLFGILGVVGQAIFSTGAVAVVSFTVAIILAGLILYRLHLNLARSRQATDDPQMLYDRCLELFSQSETPAMAQDEIPQFPGDQAAPDPNR
jgi:hypothetical protein